MAVVTSTEAGGTGRYIRYDDSAFDAMGSQTIVVYAKPSGSGGGGFGYFYGKTPTGAIGGPRLFMDHNGGTPRLGFGAASNGGTGLPTATTTAAGAYPSTWTYYTCTWDGTANAAGIILYVNNTDTTDAASRTDGGTLDSDSANPVFLLNRFGLGRELIGDVAWIAVWDRVLNSTERATVTNGTNGPLDVPSGLVLLFANDDDLSANAFTYAGRSTRVTGATPTNTALGGATAAALEFSGNVTVTKTGAALTTSITLASSVAVVVTSQAGFEPPAPAAFEFSGNVTVTKTGAALTTSKPLLGDLVVRVTSTAPLTGGSIPVTTQGGGVAVPYNNNKKKKKPVKAVVNEEWLKAEETARQLLQSRFETKTIEDKKQVLIDHVESLQPIIEKLKSLSEPVQEKEPVQETRTEPETELKQVLNQVEKLTKKLTSLEELIVVLIASQ